MLKLTQNIKLYFCISIAVTSAPIHPNKAKAMETYISDCTTQIYVSFWKRSVQLLIHM